MSVNKSKVARILDRIAAEYEAATSGLSGVAVVAQHRFITARMENMAHLQQELDQLVGDESIHLVVMRLEAIDQPQSSTN